MPTAIFHITGTVGKDPQLEHSGGGNAFCRFSVCVDRWDGGKGEERKSWFWCVVFGAVAERLVESAQQGSTVVLHGEIQEDEGDHKGKHSFIVREFDVVRNWRERGEGNRGDNRERNQRGRSSRDDGRARSERRGR